MTGQQHDDHIWLTINGEGWAIHSIVREPGARWRINLWRGYVPLIQVLAIDMTNFRADDYVRKAVAMLAPQMQED